MSPTAKLFLILGGLNAALAVYQTGVHYHLFHALGLLAVGLVATQIADSVFLRWSGWLMLTGIILFSGSLYVLSVSGLRWLGMVTPFGGMAFIAAWVLFVLAVLRAP